MSVTTAYQDGVLVLTLLRPPGNALDLDAVLLLERYFDLAIHSPPERGMVITGIGETFCAGVDPALFASHGRDLRGELVRAITRMTARLLAIPVPVVAAINGTATGTGFVLALGSDYRLLTDAPGARFGMNGALTGEPLAAGLLDILKAELGPGLARRLTLTSTLLDANTMLDLRIADEACPSDVLLSRAVDKAAVMAEQPGFRTVKRQVRGDLACSVQDRADNGNDPFLLAFG
ncbi:enoyl-CoA hydratase/isomerase family protein [Novosphingobium sp. FKTRR1]|uniref:enoyl-CoA hydratase/isomerase family protein n=1 Tax=Novosphingobium sp. FKTRR1 TaxID=2879118 RepID=UPI001CF04C42